MKPARLPFFYGWAIVAVAFVTMAIGVNARTAFSLLFPPIIDEFGWNRGVTAGAFSFGFLIAAVLSPLLGRLMDKHGPLAMLEAGVAIMATGLLLSAQVQTPWQLYLTTGVLVGVFAFRAAATRTQAILGGPMRLPASTGIDRRLIVGGIAFGVGWGLAGFCPGPALASIASWATKPLVFCLAMVAGMAIFEIHDRLKGAAAASPA